MRLLAISGSLRADSHNSRLLRIAAEEAPVGVDIEIYEGLADIPPYDADRDTSSRPSARARAPRAASPPADGLIFATPEYNSSIPGVLKNAIDWASRPRATTPLAGKPAAVMGATTGHFGAVWAQAELRKVLGSTGARVVDAEVSARARRRRLRRRRHPSRRADARGSPRPHVSGRRRGRARPRAGSSRLAPAPLGRRRWRRTRHSGAREVQVRDRRKSLLVLAKRQEQVRHPVRGGQPVRVADPHAPREDAPPEYARPHEKRTLLTDEPKPELTPVRREARSSRTTSIPSRPTRSASRPERHLLGPVASPLAERRALLRSHRNDGPGAPPRLKPRNRQGVGEAKQRDGEGQRLDPQERDARRREQHDHPRRPHRPAPAVTP